MINTKYKFQKNGGTKYEFKTILFESESDEELSSQLEAKKTELFNQYGCVYTPQLVYYNNVNSNKGEFYPQVDESPFDDEPISQKYILSVDPAKEGGDTHVTQIIQNDEYEIEIKELKADMTTVLVDSTMMKEIEEPKQTKTKKSIKSIKNKQL